MVTFHTLLKLTHLDYSSPIFRANKSKTTSFLSSPPPKSNAIIHREWPVFYDRICFKMSFFLFLLTWK